MRNYGPRSCGDDGSDISDSGTYVIDEDTNVSIHSQPFQCEHYGKGFFQISREIAIS